MADSRDFKVNIVSDASRFDLSGPAADMADVADASQDMARDTDKAADELKRLAAQGKDAQRQLDALNREVADSRFDEFGRDAKATATKTDAAFDAIGKSAKTNFKAVDTAADHAMHEAEHSTEEFRDEAKQNLSEVTSSFQGDMTSIQDLIQGTLGGLVSGLGPVGAAVGAAGAIAVGLIGKAFGDASARAEEAKASITDLFGAIVEGQGRITSDSMQSRLQNIFGDPDKVKDMEALAKRAGVSVVTYAQALAGSATAASQLRRQQTDAAKAIQDNATRTDVSTSTLVQNQIALQDTASAVGDVIDQVNAATHNANLYATAVDGMTSADAAHQAALEEVTKEQDAAAQAEADRVTSLETLQQAITDTGKAEVTRKDGTVKSIDEIIAAQDREIASKLAFETNTRKVFAAVGQAGVDWAAQFGPLAPQMMAKLAAAPKAKQKEIVAQYTQIGKLAGQSTAAGLTNSAPAVVTAVDNLHASANAELDALGKLGIKVGVDGATLSREAQLSIMALQRFYDLHPVTLTVKDPKTGAVRRVQG